MTENTWIYERMSDPLLMGELRRLRGEFEKLTARGEAAVRELDKRLTASSGHLPAAGSDAT